MHLDSTASKYARIERERRFLLDAFPTDAQVVRIREITDRYIKGTRLRLRRQVDGDGQITFKLTQKVPAPGPGSQQGFITNMYLTEDEFRIVAQLPAKELKKRRYSVPPFGIDVFEGELQGLVLAEIEFASTFEADAFPIPSFAIRDVSGDERFTGGRLVYASRQEWQSWVAEAVSQAKLD